MAGRDWVWRGEWRESARTGHLRTRFIAGTGAVRMMFDSQLDPNDIIYMPFIILEAVLSCPYY